MRREDLYTSVDHTYAMVITADISIQISQLSDDHIVSLSGKSGPYREGTTHTGRLLAYNAFEAMWQLSLKQSTIDRKYLTASDIPVGAVFKGSVKKLTDSALIVTIADGLQAVVYPDHYADIALRHPEKRFKVGSSINCRVSLGFSINLVSLMGQQVLAIDAQNHKIVLTAKKTLVESSLPLVTSFGDARVGITTHGCVRKVLDNGLVIGFYNGTKAFLPNKELKYAFNNHFHTVTKVSHSQADKTSFSIGKPLSVTIIGADAEKFRIVVSLDGDQGDAKALEEIRIGELVKGTVREIHQEQAVLMLQPMRVRALLALDHLASQRQTTVDALRGSLKLGETIKDLGVASKNVDKGLVIVKPKSLLSGSKKSLTFESLKIGQEVSGKVIGSTRKGSLVRISPTLVAILHMTDVWDDFSDGNPFPDIGSTVKGKVVALDQGLKQPSITTRLSRMGTSIVDVVDPEIEDLSDITPSQTLRGYVKSITDHGLFVTIGRDLDARIQIKELFDEVHPVIPSIFDSCS
jgi:rRNA biogenesis protein RRP5